MSHCRQNFSPPRPLPSSSSTIFARRMPQFVRESTTSPEQPVSTPEQPGSETWGIAPAQYYDDDWLVRKQTTISTGRGTQEPSDREDPHAKVEHEEDLAYFCQNLDETVTLIVGSETEYTQEFSVHIGRLRAVSTYFEAASNSVGGASAAGKFFFHADHPYFWSIFVYWLYRGKIHSQVATNQTQWNGGSAPAQSHLEDLMVTTALEYPKAHKDDAGIHLYYTPAMYLIHSYALGHRLGCPCFMNAILCSMIAHFCEGPEEEVDQIPTPAEIRYAFANTTAGSPLRDLFIDLVYHRGNEEQVLMSLSSAQHQDFILQYARTQCGGGSTGWMRNMRGLRRLNGEERLRARYLD